MALFLNQGRKASRETIPALNVRIQTIPGEMDSGEETAHMNLAADEYRLHILKNLDMIVEVLARISVGDFSRRLDVPKLLDDEFAEVFCGLDLLMSDLCEMRNELEQDAATGRLRIEIWKRAMTSIKETGGMIQDLLEEVGPRLNATRVCYLEIENPSRDAVCTKEWIPHGDKPIIGMRMNASSWEPLAEQEFLELRQGAGVSAGKREAPFEGLLCTNGIGALCAAFCRLHDRPVGLVAFADRNEHRIWLDRERLLLLELANIISAKTVQGQSADMVRAQKLESLGVLAGGLAHDFNNILAGIVGNISLARDALRHGSDAFGLLEQVEQAALRGRRLTSQLLTFSSGGTPVKEVLDLGEIIRECTPFCLSGSNVTYMLDIASDLHPVDVDKGQIEQVLNNLFINAKQAMPGGGQVRVCAENVLVERNLGMSLAAGKYVRVIVSDTGVGIQRTDLQRVFDPYFTTKKQGSGLGLAAVHSIIVKHGGHIVCDSDGWNGAAFFFYLPCSTRPLLHIHDPRVPAQPQQSGKILVMDDDDDVRTMIAGILKTRGFNTVTVRNGQEAVSAYREALSDRPFNLVIMDLTIAGGEGGKETIGKLLAIDPAVRAIVTSGYSHDPVMSDYSTYGFHGVIAKPFAVKEFMHVVHTALQK